MNCDFEEVIKKRRSIYDLGSYEVLSRKEIVKLVSEAVKYCPTAFNSQSGRVVILFGDEYQKFWDMAERKLKAITSEKVFEKTKEKIQAFKNGLGTILFFEDKDVIKNLEEKFSLYKDNFQIWAQQANGMLQYIVWTALSEKGIGASLQHYNPLVYEEVYKIWGIPSHWHLVAQMPFGSIVKPAEEKNFEPLEMRVKVFQ